MDKKSSSESGSNEWYQDEQGNWCYRGKCFTNKFTKEGMEIIFDDKCDVKGANDAKQIAIDSALKGKPTKFKVEE